MISEKENWRDNCPNCPFFDQCKSSKTDEECESFLYKEMIKSLLKYIEKYK